ncbi:hypothetical protein CTAM01_10591 [Colletotrichum tamarilloi]|uniref:Uncharacterized protein n=1 Tax=Colletotrichum tamarilloi TaxID=1209934 RepID=A0ABQ9R0D4_9PEZI|nr:uncharacterized protein CTAM01_10591 [Colletotrichum tamarilloi]KAK1490665.1 hypothetical protein CTAM01_10591 [Colletotrichum tamarilloi]
MYEYVRNISDRVPDLCVQSPPSLALSFFLRLLVDWIYTTGRKTRGLLYCAYRRAHRAAYIHSDPARYHDQIALFFEFSSVLLWQKKKFELSRWRENGSSQLSNPEALLDGIFTPFPPVVRGGLLDCYLELGIALAREDQPS